MRYLSIVFVDIELEPFSVSWLMLAPLGVFVVTSWACRQGRAVVLASDTTTKPIFSHVKLRAIPHTVAATGKVKYDVYPIAFRRSGSRCSQP